MSLQALWRQRKRFVTCWLITDYQIHKGDYIHQRMMFGVNFGEYQASQGLKGVGACSLVRIYRQTHTEYEMFIHFFAGYEGDVTCSTCAAILDSMGSDWMFRL